MTQSENSLGSGSFPLSDATSDHAHWLPFAAEKGTPVTECNLPGYFRLDKSNICQKSTFRGRDICGVELETGEFSSASSSILQLPNQPTRRVEKLVVWNHDDMPLKSDVAQQAVNLARIQHFLGSSSGIV